METDPWNAIRTHFERHMETLHSVRRTLYLVGHSPDGKVALRCRLYTIFLVLYAYNLAYGMCLDRGDIERILAVKDITSAGISLVAILATPGVYTLCNLIEKQMKREILEPILPEVKQMRAQLDLENNRTGRNIYKTLALICAVYTSVPVLQSIKVIVFHEMSKYKDNQTSGESKNTLNVEEDLSLAFHFYYPPGSATVWSYFLLSLFHTIWTIWTCMCLYCIFNSGLMSGKSTISEMRAIGLALDRIRDMTVHDKGGSYFLRRGDVGRLEDIGENFIRRIPLRDYFRRIATQHQIVCRWYIMKISLLRNPYEIASK